MEEAVERGRKCRGFGSEGSIGTRSMFGRLWFCSRLTLNTMPSVELALSFRDRYSRLTNVRCGSPTFRLFFSGARMKEGRTWHSEANQLKVFKCWRNGIVISHVVSRFR